MTEWRRVGDKIHVEVVNGTYVWDEKNNVWKHLQCECGAVKLGHPGHMHYCPMFKPPETCECNPWRGMHLTSCSKGKKK